MYHYSVIRSVLCLIVVMCMTVSATATGLKGDVNGDNKLGLEDAIYIMQVISGAR